MDYVSTRGEAPTVRFNDVLLAGLAPDGGLYVPAHWPKIPHGEIAGYSGRPYAEVAAAVLHRFAEDEFSLALLQRICGEAYAGFAHPAVTPLVQLAPNRWVLELFHGPTLAFKDLAMQVLARLMDHVLEARGRRSTIVAATSGDTGGAAIEAFRGRSRADVFILFPNGRVSEVQRRQMTTVADANVHAIAIEGSFDDCQAIVKGLFAREEFRRTVSLGAVNSINWARIAAQAAYYFAAAAALGGPERGVSFTVPTGNFGDVLAGDVARRMGLTIPRLVIATNLNDIVARTLATGAYALRAVVPTQSPSMDIQISSNFERLLFEVHDRDGVAIRRLMADLAGAGTFRLDTDALGRIRSGFAAGRATEGEMTEAMGETYRTTGYLADPHTSVGLAVARREADAATPMVTLATAHPAKFPDAVAAATGVRPALPPHLADLLSRRERFVTLPNDLAAVERHVRAHARAATS